MISQDRITSSFSRSASSYHLESIVQKEAAEFLARMLLKHIRSPIEQVVEFGAGTGHLTLALLTSGACSAACYVATDPSPEMLEQCRLNLESAGVSGLVRFKTTTAQQWLADHDEMTDLIVGSSFIQWLEDPAAWLRCTASRMPSGALAAISAYGPENLRELRMLSGSGLSGLTRSDLESLDEFYELVEFEEELKTTRFPDAGALLRHLSRTGVNACSTSPLTKSGLARLRCSLEENFRDEGGVRLTWNPVYFILKRR